ncbi:MAG: hypothetical protein IPJ09_17060 [Saprospiraceae bacterium]|nr:hypothetical protein [Saprospiraceae bacterium]
MDPESGVSLFTDLLKLRSAEASFNCIRSPYNIAPSNSKEIKPLLQLNVAADLYNFLNEWYEAELASRLCYKQTNPKSSEWSGLKLSLKIRIK